MAVTVGFSNPTVRHLSLPVSRFQASFYRTPFLPLCDSFALSCFPKICGFNLAGQEGHIKDILKTWKGRKKYAKSSRNGIIQASLFGVGAPEAIVIGVVALIVFGPKGLAEIARSIGKSLRAFQPTLRELQEVSREFKSTLEQEMGLDELRAYESKYPENNVKSNQQFESPMNAKQDMHTDNGAHTTMEYARSSTEETNVPVTKEQWQGSEAAVALGNSPVALNTKDVEDEQPRSEVSQDNMGAK